MKNYVKKRKDQYGTTFYLNKKGFMHRTDGPAVEYASGSKVWYLNGKRHREDGAGLIDVVAQYKSYYLNNKIYKKEDFIYQTKYKETYQFSI